MPRTEKNHTRQRNHEQLRGKRYKCFASRSSELSEGEGHRRQKSCKCNDSCGLGGAVGGAGGPIGLQSRLGVGGHTRQDLGPNIEKQDFAGKERSR